MSHTLKRVSIIIISVQLFLNSGAIAQHNMESGAVGFGKSFNNPSEQPAMNKCKAQELYLFLKEYDLNEQTQNGFSITQKEYQKLIQLWKKLSRDEKTMILCGSVDTSLPNTYAQFLLYGINNGKSWYEVIQDLDRIGAKECALTFSSVKGLVTLEMVHNTLLDLLYKEKDMIINGRLSIDPVIKYHVLKRKNRQALDRLEKWEKFINDSQHLSNQRKIECVNSFFNDLISAKLDKDYNKNCDYWQSPIETLVRGKGDCEDFAIAKYVSLRILGIPKEQLHIAVIRLPRFGELHAVLFYYPDGENDPWVLDNLAYNDNGYFRNLIRLSFKITYHNVTPLLAFNENSYAEFRRGIKKHYLDKNPVIEIPMFSIAINNSKNLLSNLSG